LLLSEFTPSLLLFSVEGALFSATLVFLEDSCCLDSTLTSFLALSSLPASAPVLAFPFPSPSPSFFSVVLETTGTSSLMLKMPLNLPHNSFLLEAFSWSLKLLATSSS
jgi:hypothetical protein